MIKSVAGDSPASISSFLNQNLQSRTTWAEEAFYPSFIDLTTAGCTSEWQNYQHSADAVISGFCFFVSRSELRRIIKIGTSRRTKLDMLPSREGSVTRTWSIELKLLLCSAESHSALRSPSFLCEEFCSLTAAAAEARK